MSSGRGILIFSSAVSVLIIILAVILFALNTLSSGIFLPLFYGWSIASFNFFLGMLFIIKGLRKSDRSFIKIFLGGMIFRLLLLLMFVFLSLKFLQLNEISFIFSIFIFYIFYLIIEILYLSREKV
jgi:hypothetical protein